MDDFENSEGEGVGTVFIKGGLEVAVPVAIEAQGGKMGGASV